MPLSGTQAAQDNPQFIVIAGSDSADHLAHFWQTMYFSLLVQHSAVMQMSMLMSEDGGPGFYTFSDSAAKDDQQEITSSDRRTIVSLATALAVESHANSGSEVCASDMPSQAHDEDSVYEADWMNIPFENPADWSSKAAGIIDFILGVLWMPCSVLIQVFEFLCEGFAQFIMV